ncbi:NADPH-dependent FMN reductase [Sphingomonas endophytica]|uniref:NADPH-dependent FMN reductase n=1 Tax=Sphingomonas endophytica TaxID=869719 RepID=UPI000A3E4DCE
MARTVAIIVGSIRKESINLKLAKALVKLAPNVFDCDFILIDDLPVYNQDLD